MLCLREVAMSTTPRVECKKQNQCIGYRIDIRRLLEAADRVVFGHLKSDDTHGSVVSLDAVVRDIKRKHTPAPPRFTAQELFDAVAADPRVKAYPRLVDCIKGAIRTYRHEAANATGDDKAAWEQALAELSALLRELGEE